MKKEKRHTLLLQALFAIYILLNIDTPIALAKLVDTTIGNGLIMLLAITMFAAAGPFTGVLALLAAYSLITRSSRATGSVYKQLEYESEEIKMQLLSEQNSFPRTLEEDIIVDMAPIIRDDGGMIADYKPLLGNLNNASPVNS